MALEKGRLHDLVTAVLAAFGAKLATMVGSVLPGFALALAFLPASPVLRGVIRLLTVPSVMATALLFGAVLARWRPSASVGAVLAGLACFALAPLLALAGGGALASVLLGCAAEGIVALCFAWPFARRAGVVASGGARLGYAASVSALFPVVAWWALGDVGRPSVSVTPLGAAGTPIVSDTFVPPPFARGGEAFETALAQALREGRVPEDPAGRALRVAVLDGAGALRAAPCDAAARGRLRTAILTYLQGPPSSDRPSVEMFTAAGETHRVTPALNRPAVQVVLDALRGGVVALDDLPARTRLGSAVHEAAKTPDPASPLRCR